MARYRGPRVKICRALGVTLPGLTNRAVMSNNPPGMHGAGRRGKPSDYKIRLKEKQKLRYHFGVLEGQFKRYVAEAARRKGPTGHNLITLLESRLDNVIWRLGFAPTIPAARQMVVHGHIEVNGRRVDRPSYSISLNDEVGICAKSIKKPFMQNNLDLAASRVLPQYLDVDLATGKGRMNNSPSFGDLPFPCDLQQVVEYYSQQL